MNSLPDWKPGDELTADGLNAPRVAIRAESLASTGPASVRRTTGRTDVSRVRALPIIGLLSGASSPYSFTQQVDTAGGTWATGPLTGTAYEVNGVAGLASTRHRLYPDRFGAWRFQAIKHGASDGGGSECGCWGLGEVPETLTATWSLGSITLTRGTTADAFCSCWWSGEAFIDLGAVGCSGETVSVKVGLKVCRSEGPFGTTWSLSAWFYGTLIFCGSGCVTFSPGPSIFFVSYGTQWPNIAEDCPPFLLEFTKDPDLDCVDIEGCTSDFCLLFPGGGPVTITL